LIKKQLTASDGCKDIDLFKCRDDEILAAMPLLIIFVQL